MNCTGKGAGGIVKGIMKEGILVKVEEHNRCVGRGEHSSEARLRAAFFSFDFAAHYEV